jgi:hypothetical protein
MRVEWPAGLTSVGLPQPFQPSKRGLFGTMRPGSWITSRQPGDQPEGESATRRRKRQQQASDAAAAATAGPFVAAGGGSRAGSFTGGGGSSRGPSWGVSGSAAAEVEDGLEQIEAAGVEGVSRSTLSELALTRPTDAPLFNGLRVSCCCCSHNLTGLSL